jgi:hypothetical protein
MVIARVNWKVLLGIMITFMADAIGSAQVYSQNMVPLRVFTLDGVHNNDPIQVIGFRVAGQVIKPGVPIQASEEEWLKSSNLVVKNVSDKEIIGIWINLFFPEVVDAKGMTGDQVQIGNRASSEKFTRQGSPLHDNDYPLFSLKPGQSYEIALGHNYEDTFSLRSRVNPIVIPRKCIVRFAAVYFRNGMKWSPGYFGRPDPSRPGEFITITPSEFWASKD